MRPIIALCNIVSLLFFGIKLHKRTAAISFTLLAAVLSFPEIPVYARDGKPVFLREFGGALPGAAAFGDLPFQPIFVEAFFCRYVEVLSSRSSGKPLEILYPYGFGVAPDRLREVGEQQVVFIPHVLAPSPPDRERPPLPRPVSSRSAA